ncbi:unnamed protein product [Blepharisma stoltei]|uniref:CHAD domain-containing protein n=1 Tax=Blepharisma stoltei TaxID=1481888 RepID=A0AAU9IIT7_9CILI|nr:unnamed protein product [Blepharisma stoltei]
MNLEEDLRITLNRTLELAVGLEQLNFGNAPRQFGERARKRIISISGDIKGLAVLMKQNEKPINFTPSSARIAASHTATPKEVVIEDTPVFKTKKKLSYTLQETNHRLKQNRAGKKTVSDLIDQKVCPPLNRTHLSLDFNENKETSLCSGTYEKPLPYVSLTNGKIEPPIRLPTFNEYLKFIGDEYVFQTGKSEFLHRIDKAEHKLSSLKINLDSKLIGKPQRTAATRHRLTRGRNLRVQFSRRWNSADEENLESLISRTREIKDIMEKYFPTEQKREKLLKNEFSDYVSPENSLDNTLKKFYKSKAMENQKLADILDRMKIDRPNSLKKKIFLIQDDHEKYKNQLYSIKKFDGFRENVEVEKRKAQLKTYKQGLLYLKILETFRAEKHQPNQAELDLLNNWKAFVEGGITIKRGELDKMKDQLDLTELSDPQVKDLLEKFEENIY